MKTINSVVLSYLTCSLGNRLIIATGGQTGTDRAAMDTALKYKFALMGWCPKGRIAEDGAIDSKYPLQESVSSDPAIRTELNVIDSDATLLLSIGDPQDGTPLTIICAKHYQRPHIEFDLASEPNVEVKNDFWRWIQSNSVKVLNVAGPRESHMPGVVYSRSIVWLEFLLGGNK